MFIIKEGFSWQLFSDYLVIVTELIQGAIFNYAKCFVFGISSHNILGTIWRNLEDLCKK